MTKTARGETANALRRRALGFACAAAACSLALPPTTEAEAAGGCRPQKPQAFLVRKNYLSAGALDPSAHTRALRYRAETYGSVPAGATSQWNATPASSFSQTTTFMGLKLQVHRKIVPALACVERELERACSATPYKPTAVGGFRDRNTYHTGEVTNHLFGIAIDIDPHRNPCCHCVEPWPDDPHCRTPAKTPYDRAALPACWVKTFGKYGFYWLGDDKLEDTMHFEFLGRPERVSR